MKKYDPVMIRWRDSHSPPEVWIAEEDIHMDRDYIVPSVGMFLYKNDKWVVICLGGRDKTVIRPLKIPRKAIVEMRVLK